MAKKRTPPTDLVGLSVAKPYERKTWYDKLPRGDRDYVDAVADEMRDNRGASPYLVADALISELRIEASRQTVVRVLKRLINGKA